MPDEPRIGSLRWPVTIAKRAQATSGTATLSESLTDIVTVNADIQAIGPMTYLQGQQTDRPITHRITIRWLDWLDETFVLIRRSLRADLSSRIEVFRIRRMMELGGRKRFLSVEVELELRQ